MQFINIHTTDILFIASKIYSGKNKVTIFIVLQFFKSFVWYKSVFNKYSFYCHFFRLGPESRLCHCHCHVWVCYFDTTKIMVWCMSSILIHMIYFSIYTIFISEHYRAIVSYCPTPSQQVSVIFWNITITFWLQSQVRSVTCFCFFNAWHFYITKYRNTLHRHYFVVTGTQFWTTGRFKVLADCQCILHHAIIISSK